MITDKEFSETVKNMRNHTKRPENEGDYWSNEDKQKLIRHFVDGIGITEIAVILQRSEWAVMQQIEKLDLYERKANPQRSRSSFKPPVCLCEICRLDRSSCPRCTLLEALQEGA